MYIHNLEPIIFDVGFFSLRWYSLAYIFGIILGWWYGKNIIENSKIKTFTSVKNKDFDALISYIIISIIIGGRLGYVIFYNFSYYFLNPIEIIMIWKGGMSFHGGLLGVIVGTIFFAKKYNLDTLIYLDIIACVAPIGLFFGRIANFINGELYGKPTNLDWGVIFPDVDNLPRHPSQLYESFLEGIILFLILNFTIFKFNYKKGLCAALFLIFYGAFRIFSEIYREPDIQIGYFFNLLSMGTLLSFLMIIAGSIMYFKIK